MSRLRAFTMPKWGIEMTEGTLAEWSIREGEAVSKGQIVAQIETDKIVNEVESEFPVTFVRLLAQPGEIYPVGELLAVMAEEAVSEKDIEAFITTYRADSKAGVPAAAQETLAAAPEKASPIQNLNISPAAEKLAQRLNVALGSFTGSGRNGRITYQDVEQASRPARAVGGGAAVSVEVQSTSLDGHYASPYAKRLALAHGVDLKAVKGTGARGRISRADVLKAGGIAATPAGSTYETVRMSSTRKAIAKQLSLSKSTIPHFYLRTPVKLDALLELRHAAKQAGGKPPSVNDYFIRASALALTQNPDVNIQVLGDEIRRFKHANIAVAVAAERGLITPVVRAADLKTLQQLARETAELIERARTGKLRAEEIEGGTFSVSNLGMFGIDQFDAIINPPQGAILAVGSAVKSVVAQGNGFALATVVNLSLSCDHRAIDGAVGAKFLSSLRDLIEAPQQL